MEWKVLTIALIVCGMCYVEAGVNGDNGQICANQTDIDNMNARVTEITTALGPILMNDSLTEMEKMPLIFNMTCQDTYKTKVEMIAALLKRCPGVKTASSSFLDDLDFFGTNFLVVLDDFGTVDDFCACRAFVPTAWTIKTNVDKLEKTISGPATKVFEPYELCTLAAERNMSGVIHKAYELEKLIKNNITECTKLHEGTGFTALTQMLKVTGFIIDKCPPLANLSMLQDKYQCVVDELNNPGAIECFSKDISTTDISDLAKCSRRKCVMKHANKCVGMGIEAYIYGVNLYKDKTWISTYDCDSAISVQTSIVLLFVAVLRYFL